MAEDNNSIKKLTDTYTRKKSKQNNLTGMEVGKVLPQARELEEAVLGAIMLESEAIDVVLEILKPETFYLDAHQKIFTAMRRLYEDDQPIDILTVVDRLKLSGELQYVGGSFYVASLTNKVASSANLEYHARLLAQKYLKRSMITVSNELIRDAFDDTVDVFDLLDKAESNIFALTEDNLKKNAERISSVLVNEIEDIDDRRKKYKDGEMLTGVGSGFTDLDRLTAGWQKSDLIIVAARPGMGKTAFTLALARNAAVDLDKPVAFFSLEMSNNQLVSRLISMETEIDSQKLRKGELLEREWKHLMKNVDSLQQAPIFIDDTPAINVFELRAKCRRLKAKHDIQMVMIDYLQLMSGSADTKGNREQEISQISRALKGLAKELNVPVIALSQLSRAVESRGGAKRPMLSDLRESGAIEQDADMVIFLYRPEYYGITQDEDGLDCRGLGEIIVAKNRHGSLETVKVRFIGKYAKFANLESNRFGDVQQGDFGQTITVSSKMNDIGGDNLNNPNPFDDLNPPPATDIINDDEPPF